MCLDIYDRRGRGHACESLLSAPSSTMEGSLSSPTKVVVEDSKEMLDSNSNGSGYTKGMQETS